MFSQQSLGPWAGRRQVGACAVLTVTCRRETKQHFEQVSNIFSIEMTIIAVGSAA